METLRMVGHIETPLEQHVSLPVFFIDPSGSKTADHIHGSPCVDITFVSTSGAPAAAVRALVDTGADYIYLERDLVSLLQLPLVREITANGAPSSVHQAVISLPSLRIQWQNQICARDIRSHGNGFDAILGRQFLQYGRLIYDVQRDQRPSFVIDTVALGRL